MQYKTESKNPAVLEVYDFIVEHEDVDSDYWNEDHGPKELNSIFEDSFTEPDWEELAMDLKHWTTRQLEILLYAVMNGYSYNPAYEALYKERPELLEEVTRIIPNKADLIIPILNLGIERGRLTNDIILTAIEEAHFLTNHFDILLEKDVGYLYKIQKMIDLMGRDYVMQENPALKDKMDRAIRQKGL